MMSTSGVSKAAEVNTKLFSVIDSQGCSLRTVIFPSHARETPPPPPTVRKFAPAAPHDATRDHQQPPIMADSATDSANIAEQYSLLPKLMPNLDRHLIYPLLNFSSDEEEEQSIEQKKLLLELLKPTNMTDFVGQLYQDVHDLPDMPDEYKQKRDQVIQRRDKLEEETSKISGLLDDESVVTNLRSDKVQNLAYLKDTHGVTVEMVNQLYEFGQFQYSCGVYPHAAELLYRFRVLVRLRYRAQGCEVGADSMIDHGRRQRARSHMGQARLRNPLRELGRGHRRDQQAQRTHRHPPLQQPPRTTTSPYMADPLVAVSPLQPRARPRNSHRLVLLTRLHQHHPDKLPMDPALPRCCRHHKPKQDKKLESVSEAAEGLD
jgi:hypothetical protein